jgi:uncharacterized protein related to proFAR isomerase
MKMESTSSSSASMFARGADVNRVSLPGDSYISSAEVHHFSHMIVDCGACLLEIMRYGLYKKLLHSKTSPVETTLTK